MGQFILTVLATFPAQFDPSQPYFLKRSSVPLYKWGMSAAMFFAVNMLNNWAFAFNIAVPVHIVLRSFGSASTMAAGWLRGKRYSTLQVFSVALLTVGVIVSARADAAGKVGDLNPQAFLAKLNLISSAGQVGEHQGHQLFGCFI